MKLISEVTMDLMEVHVDTLRLLAPLLRSCAIASALQVPKSCTSGIYPIYCTTMPSVATTETALFPFPQCPCVISVAVFLFFQIIGNLILVVFYAALLGFSAKMISGRCTE